MADLGNNNAMVLYNHGLLAAGESVHAAFHTLYFLERACQAQIKAQSAGAELIVPSEARASTLPSSLPMKTRLSM